MELRQSDLKQWQRCPLAWKYQNIDGMPREQSGSLIFGSIIHDCTLFLEETRDLEGALARFKNFWLHPDQLDPSYQVDYYVRATNWKKFADEGERTLRDWWDIIQWDSDLTLAREYSFAVPIGDGHILQGTADKVVIRFRPALNSQVLLISDYKTNNKVPTYGYLEEDLQFSAYCYASTRPEFWATLPGGRGMELMEQYKDLPRYGEWVQIRGPKRMDAGERTQRHYNRLTYAINAMALSVGMRIFVPNISGESCRYCEYRKPCGLPDIEDTLPTY